MVKYINELLVISVKTKRGKFTHFFLRRDVAPNYARALHCAFTTYSNGELVKTNAVRANPQNYRERLKRQKRRGRYEERPTSPHIANKMKELLQKEMEKDWRNRSRRNRQ